MLKFLSQESRELLQQILPFALDISANRIANYLSFYLSNSSKHLYHCPNILSHSSLQEHFDPNNLEQLMDTPESRSAQHLFAKMLLSVHFQEHVVDEKGALRLYAGLSRLKMLKKQDLLEEFLKSRCIVNINDGKISPKTHLNPLHRRTIYVSYNCGLPDPSSLTQLITLNPLYQLHNLNKVLVFGEPTQPSLQLPASLERFCKEYSINIKLLKDSSLQGLMSYVYLRTKRNVLVHQTIHNQHSIYDLHTPEDKLKTVQGKTINPLNQHLMPQEIAVFTQRLPRNSLVVDDKEIILTKMRGILGLEEGQSLMDPAKTLAFSVLQKNYVHEDIEDDPDESKHGFTTRRFATIKNYEFNRTEQHVPYSPFHKKLGK